MNYDKKRWVFLFLGIVINICAGFGYAWSVFQKPLIDLFHWQTASVSMAFTFIMSVSALPQALAGKAQEFIEPRQVTMFGGILLGLGVLGMGYVQSLSQLYLSSILVGLGIGIVYSGVVSNIVKFFPDKRGLASGVLAAGMGSGAIIIAPLASILILNYGVQTTFKTFGLTFIVLIFGLSRFIKTAPNAHTTVESKQAAKELDYDTRVNKNWNEMLKDLTFYVLAGVFVVGGTSGMMIMGHASPIAQETLKVSPQIASVIVAFLALANTSGRIFWGSLSDKTGRYPILFAMFLIGGVSMLSLTKVSTFYTFLAAILTVALCYGGFMGMMASLTADTFGEKYLGVNFGIMFLTVAIAAYIGPRLAAVVRAYSGDYSQAFAIASIFSLVGILFTFIALYRKRKIISSQNGSKRNISTSTINRPI